MQNILSNFFQSNACPFLLEIMLNGLHILFPLPSFSGPILSQGRVSKIGNANGSLSLGSVVDVGGAEVSVNNMASTPDNRLAAC